MGKEKDNRSSCSFVIWGCSVVGTIIFLMWIILLTAQTPKISLLDLNIPIKNNNDSTLLTFKLKFKNTNGVGLLYSDLTTSFVYVPSNKSTPFAYVILPGFHQGKKKTTVKNGTLETKNVDWSKVFKLGGNGTGVVHQVRVHVDGSVRFKHIFWMYKKRGMRYEVVAILDGQGRFTDEKGLRLYKSDGAKWSSLDMNFGLVLLVAIMSNFAILI